MFWMEVAFLVTLLSGVGADCVAGFYENGHQVSVKVVIPPKPKTWAKMQKLCRNSFSGRRLVMLHTYLSNEQKRKCGDKLVPVFISIELDDVPASGIRDLTKYELNLRDKSYPKLKEGRGALNVTSGLWHIVEKNFQFSCVICDMSLKDDLKMKRDRFEEVYQITLVSSQVDSKTRSTAKEMNNLRAELFEAISTPLIPGDEPKVVFYNCTQNRENQWVGIFYYIVRDTFDVDIKEVTRFLKAWSSNPSSESLKQYEIEVEDMSTCPEEITVVSGNKHDVWPLAQPGRMRTFLDTSTDLITRRMCVSDVKEYKYSWSKPTFWKIVRMPCTAEDQLINDKEFVDYLRNNKAVHKFNVVLILLVQIIIYFLGSLQNKL